MDQHKEEEENNSQESTDQRKEEEEKDSEEFVDQRKGDEEEKDSEELTDQRKEEEEESSEEAMAASSVFVHPCSLLQYIVRVCACCLGFRDSSSDPQAGAAIDAPAPDNSSQVGEDEKPYFYMQEVITRVWAARKPRPPPPGNPAEGSGGNGGQHN